MSICVTASCLAHRERMFIRLDETPYTWVHSGGMAPCDSMPPASNEDASEVCACGDPSGRHEAEPGPLPHGLVAKPRPCRGCGCADFRHEWQREAA